MIVVVNLAMYNAAAYNGLQVYKKFLCGGGNTYIQYMNYDGMKHTWSDNPSFFFLWIHGTHFKNEQKKKSTTYVIASLL